MGFEAAALAGRPGPRLAVVGFFTTGLFATDVLALAGRPTARLVVAGFTEVFADFATLGLVAPVVDFFGLPGPRLAVVVVVVAVTFLGGLPGPRFAVVVLAAVFVEAVFLGRPGPRLTVVASTALAFGGRPGPRTDGIGVLASFTAATFFSAALITA